MLNYTKYIATIGLIFGCFINPVQAQKFPDKPIHIIVPYGAGGGTDTTARYLAKRLTEKLGQSVVIENRSGAGGILASSIVAKANPDGHTLLLSSSAHAVNQTLYRKLPYDTSKDFAPVAFLVMAPNIMVVNPDVPAHSVQEFIALAKSNPGQFNFGSGGLGSMPYLAGELFKSMADIDMTHVPYKGGNAATTDLIAGRLQVIFGGMVLTLPFVDSGQLRAIAVTSANRAKNLPDMPTVIESGLPGYEASDWFGVFAPSQTPREVVELLNMVIRDINKEPDTQEFFDRLGAEAIDMSTQDFSGFVDNEIQKWKTVIEQINVYAD